MIKEVKAYREEANKINKKIQSIEKEEAAIDKNCRKGYKSVEKVQNRLVELEIMMNTESMTPQEERNFIKEKTDLENSVEYAERFDKLMPEKKVLRDQRKEINQKISSIRKQLDRLNATLDSLNAEFDAMKNAREEFKDELDKLEAKVQVHKEEIGEIRKKKDECKEGYFKELYEFEMESREIKHVEWKKKRL